MFKTKCTTFSEHGVDMHLRSIGKLQIRSLIITTVFWNEWNFLVWLRTENLYHHFPEILLFAQLPQRRRARTIPLYVGGASYSHLRSTSVFRWRIGSQPTCVFFNQRRLRCQIRRCAVFHILRNYDNKIVERHNKLILSSSGKKIE